MHPVCREHPAVDAHYRCDDCGRPLCDRCVELASRLAVCLPCGGLARPLPVGGEPPAGSRGQGAASASGATPEIGPRPLALAVSARTFFPVHVVGGVLETVLGLYGAVLGAHVAGLILGRHRDELEALYLG
jgi:hypothetical protein